MTGSGKEEKRTVLYAGQAPAMQATRWFNAPTSSFAQEPQTDSLRLIERATRFIMEGKPLAGVKEFESASPTDSTILPVVATLQVFASESSGVLKTIERSYPPQNETMATFPMAVEPLPAIDAIVNEAKNHRIVIEAQHLMT